MILVNITIIEKKPWIIGKYMTPYRAYNIRRRCVNKIAFLETNIYSKKSPARLVGKMAIEQYSKLKYAPFAFGNTCRS